MITLESISAQKAGRRIFHDFSLTIKPGENLLVAGDNGSGKTTLLEVISGALPVSAGRVHYAFVNGNDWDERFEQRKRAIHFIPAVAAIQSLHQPDLFYQQRYYSL